MRNFRFTLKHDNGYKSVIVKACDLISALSQILASEGCPQDAITNIRIKN